MGTTEEPMAWYINDERVEEYIRGNGTATTL